MPLDMATLGLAVDTSEVKAAVPVLENLASAAERAGKGSDVLTQSMIRQNVEALQHMDAIIKNNAATEALSTATQRLLDRYDPLGTKLRSLQADFANLNKEISGGAGSLSSDTAVDKAFKGLNADIAQTKALMAEAGAIAGGPAAEGLEKAGAAGTHLGLGSAYARRELIILGREVMEGNFARIPGTMLTLAAHTGLFSAAFIAISIPVLAATAVIGGFIYATMSFAKGLEEANAALDKTSNFAGMTTDSMQALSQQVADTSSITIRSAKDMVTAIVASGQYSADNVALLAGLVDNYAAVTGESAKKAGAELTKMFEDPTKASLELDKAMHYLTADQYEHIKNLQEEGKFQEAVTAAVKALSDHLPDHITKLSGVAAIWDHILKDLSQAVDDLGKIGATMSPAQDLAATRARLALPGNSPEDIDAYQMKAQKLEKEIADNARLATEKAKIAQYDKEQLATQLEIDKSLQGQLTSTRNKITKLEASTIDTPAYWQRLIELYKQADDEQKKLDEFGMTKSTKSVKDYTAQIDGLQAQLDKLTGADGGMSNWEKVTLEVSADMEKSGKAMSDQQAQLLLMALALDDATKKKKADTEALKEWVAAMNNSIASTELWQAGVDKMNLTGDAFAESMKKLVDQSNLQRNALGLSAMQLKIEAENLKIDEEATKAVNAIKKELIDTINKAKLANKDFTDADKQALQDIADAEIAGVNAHAAAAKAITATNTEAQQTFSEGWTAAWRKFSDEATNGAKQAQEIFNGLTQSLEKLFEDLFNHTGNAFSNFLSSLRSMVSKFAAQQLTQALGSGLGLGGGGGIGGLLSSLFGGASGGAAAYPGGAGAMDLGGPATGILGGLGTSFGALTDVVTGTASAAGTFGMSLLAAVPAVGAIVAVGFLAYDLLSQAKGGPKSGGSAMAGAATSFPSMDTASGTRFFTPNSADAALQTLTSGSLSSYNAIAAALGGTAGGASFASGYDTDPKGTAASRVRNAVMIGGRQVYSNEVTTPQGDDAALQAAVALEAKRAILAALQATDLPKVVADFIKKFDPKTVSSDTVDNVVAMASAMKTLDTVMKANPVGDALKAMSVAAGGAYFAVQNMGGALAGMAQKMDGSAASSAALAAATTQYYNALVTELATIIQMKAQVLKSGSDTIRSMTMDTLDTAGKKAYLQADMTSLGKQLSTATNPDDIKRIHDQIMQDLTDSWGLLTPDEKKQGLADYTKSINDLNAITNKELTAASAKLTADANAILASVKTAMDAAADKMVTAADTQLKAANTPLDVNVSITAPTGTTASAEVDSGS